MLKYKWLIRHPKFKDAWTLLSTNEFGKVLRGTGGCIKNPNNTCFFIDKSKVHEDRFKDVTYCKFVCSVRPQKEEWNWM